MRVLRIPRRHHARAELTCPPLGWRAVGRRVACACAATAATGAGSAVVLLRPPAGPHAWWAPVAVGLVSATAASVLWLTHLLNAARTPVTFKVANGELVVSKPFLFARRSRRVAVADVRSVRVSATGGASSGGASSRDNSRGPTGRLSIRRRYRLPIRVPGRRPLAQLDLVAEELRAALHV